jgi:alpha/beta superfamily hydrolase
MYGENDLPPVLNMVTARAGSLKDNPRSMQIKVPKSDHFYNNHEEEMVRDVKDFLDGFK